MTEEKKPRDWRRVGGILTALCVAAIAGIGSFAHLRDLAIINGQIPAIATLIPFSVDGLIVCATFCLNGDNQRWPRVGFTLGVVATISGNILIALAPKSMAVAIAVSAWPPIALLVTIEILVHYRPRKPAVVAADVAAKPVQDDLAPATEDQAAPKPRTRNRRGIASDKKLAAAWKRNPDATPAELAAKAGTSESTARRFINDQKAAEIDAELAAITDVPATVPA